MEPPVQLELIPLRWRISSKNGVRRRLGTFPSWGSINEIKRAKFRQRISSAQAVCENEVWSIEDLKQISDSSSSIYTHAIKQGMPEGLARGMQAEMHAFKKIYRWTASWDWQPAGQRVWSNHPISIAKKLISIFILFTVPCTREVLFYEWFWKLPRVRNLMENFAPWMELYIPQLR